MLILKDGTTVTGDLVICADGKLLILIRTIAIKVADIVQVYIREPGLSCQAIQTQNQCPSTSSITGR